MHFLGGPSNNGRARNEPNNLTPNLSSINGLGMPAPSGTNVKLFTGPLKCPETDDSADRVPELFMRGRFRSLKRRIANAR